MILTTTTGSTWQSNITLMSIIFLLVYLLVFSFREAFSVWLLRCHRLVVLQQEKKGTSELAKNWDQKQKKQQNKAHYHLCNCLISGVAHLQLQIQVGWCVSCVLVFVDWPLLLLRSSLYEEFGKSVVAISLFSIHKVGFLSATPKQPPDAKPVGDPP